MYNSLLTKKLAENTKSLKCDLCLLANGMVYHIGVCATAHNIPGFLIGSHGYIEKLGTKWGRKQKNWDCHFIQGYSATPTFQDAVA